MDRSRGVEGPDLRGWGTAAAAATAAGIAASTVRRRAARGMYDVIPNPIGPGALYRPLPPSRHGGATSVVQTRYNPAQLPWWDDSRLTDRDRLVLIELMMHGGGVVPTSRLAAAAGCTHNTVRRSIDVLTRCGYAAAAEPRSGPRGGRPEMYWRPLVP